MGKIVLLSDIYDIKRRKQQELAFYHKQLEELQRKMANVRQEIDLTNMCIQLVERDGIVDLRERAREEESIRG